MKVRWKDDEEEKRQGDVVAAVVKDGVTYIIVRGEDGKMHEVPIERFEP